MAFETGLCYTRGDGREADLTNLYVTLGGEGRVAKSKKYVALEGGKGAAYSSVTSMLHRGEK